MKRYLSIIISVIVFLSAFTVMTSAAFENTHKNTGSYADDIAEISLTQVGCTADESEKYGNNVNASLNFIIWCADEAKIPNEVIPTTETVSNLYDFFTEGMRINANPDYIPERGDILFIGDDGITAENCAIVISTDTQFVTAVICDNDNTVKKKLYTIGMEKIIAYATPDYSYVSNYTTGKHMTTASFLNLRKEPNTSCTVLTKIPIGTIVDITDFSSDGAWGYITYNGYNGWISMDYAVLYDDSHAGTSEYAVNWNVIDVSKWQGNIDWSKVASGDIKAVIMRIGLRGSLTREILIDERFLEYYKGAKEQGLHVGCYFYSTATTTDEAKAEAQFVIDTINKYDLEFDMPVYIDMEDAVTERCGKTAIFNITYTFLSEMDKVNIYSGVYCSTSWASDYYNDALFSNHALWIADWHDKCSYSGEYGMWQYTEHGGVSGIESRYTDLNICYIDYPRFISDNEYNTEKIPSADMLIGDINADGSVTASDARIALRISANLYSPTYTEKIAADVTGDGRITAADARKILRIAAKLE